MRVVLDTNVLVSAFVFPGGPPEAVFRLGLEDRITLVTSRPLLGELGRVLGEKFAWDEDRVEEAVAQVLRLSALPEIVEAVAEIAADPDDDRVLEAALAGEVDAIVSGDRHLLRLGSWRGIRVLRPTEFLAEFERIRLDSQQSKPGSLTSRTSVR